MATVIGVTSRGLFVRIANDRVIFVSFEPWRGPLTITLQAGSLSAWPAKQSLETGAVAHISNARLIFPTIDVSIAVMPGAIWRYPDAAIPARSIDERLKAIRLIAREVLTRRNDTGFGAWLPELLGLSGEIESRRGQPAPVDLVSLRQALAVGDFTRGLDLMNRLLGFGRGLTPSGDDGAIGLLLMLNRWCRDDDWSELNRPVIHAAYQRTTTISANLIECAADGQGDERLVKVVDGIVTGEPSVAECVECVLDWGSSSGIDALVGMAVAITMWNKNA